MLELEENLLIINEKKQKLEKLGELL